MGTLVVTGTVVTFDPDRPEIEDGAVYVDGDTIEAVAADDEAAPLGYDDAPRVKAGGIIYPGLIDLHSHLAYNFLTLWRAPRDEPYTTRYQWPSAATYGREISNPAQALGIAAAAATLRYAEVKAAVGGVTAIQGSPPLTRSFPGWMVRNIEKDPFPGMDGSGGQRIYQSVLPAEPEKLKTYAKRLANGQSFIYHLAEGTSPNLIEEFEELRRAGCIHNQLIGIHSTALGAPQLKEWGDHGGAVVWSPLSNIWLYGGTTDVVAAMDAGLRVCLGSDWGPSGCKNVLGELKVAALWNDEQLGGALSSQQLCEMVTANPGDTLALAWGRQGGRLVPGALADMVITRRRDADVYRSLVAVDERHVRLVIVGGRPVVGVTSLMTAAGAVHLERLNVGGQRRSVCMRLPAELVPAAPDLAAQANLSWADGMAVMEAVREDPLGAVTRAQERVRSGAAPLQFIPDMPGPDGGDTRALTEDELRELVMAPIDTLAHDGDFFDRIDRDAPPHAEILRRLRKRFRR